MLVHGHCILKTCTDDYVRGPMKKSKYRRVAVDCEHLNCLLTTGNRV